jgi:hypothetical protein
MIYWTVMTHIQINLPDNLADEARRAGLLAPEKMAALLRAELSAQRVNDLRAARTALKKTPLGLLSVAEIAAEIEAYRLEHGHADRS